jgi:hypothetical protein
MPLTYLGISEFPSIILLEAFDSDGRTIHVRVTRRAVEKFGLDRAKEVGSRKFDWGMARYDLVEVNSTDCS